MSRPVLRLRLKPESPSLPSANDQQDAVDGVGSVETIISNAIALKHRLGGSYNNGRVVLEPCLLYRDNDVLFLLAVTALRDGKPPREPKLGTFRLAGLNDVKRFDEMFLPDDLHRSWTVKPNWEVVAGLRAQAIASRPKSG